MTEADFIRKQLIHVRSRAKSLLSSVAAEHWYTIPEGIDSSLAWQAGHIVLSQYFNGIVCTVGRDKSMYEVFNVKQFAQAYGMGSKATPWEEGMPTKDDLLKAMDGVMERCLIALDSIPLESYTGPVTFKHPTYKTIGDVLHWQYHHEMWHCGQIATVRRGLGIPLQFNP